MSQLSTGGFLPPSSTSTKDSDDNDSIQSDSSDSNIINDSTIFVDEDQTISHNQSKSNTSSSTEDYEDSHLNITPIPNVDMTNHYIDASCDDIISQDDSNYGRDDSTNDYDDPPEVRLIKFVIKFFIILF